MVDYLLKRGNCLDVMTQMVKDGMKVHSIVTDPPYHFASIVSRFGKEGSAPTVDQGVYRRSSKGFMGKEWDGGDIAFNKDTWKMCLDLLLPGGHLLAFAATKNYHRMACAIEDAGFEIRDQIGWVYGTGFPKSHKIGDGWKTALKPAWEPICVARKPIDHKTIAKNFEEHNVGGFNIEECRIPLNGDYKSKANGRPSQTGLDDNYDPEKANIPDTLGRYPANIIHDGSDEVIEAFPGESQRFFYSAKTSKEEKQDTTHPTVKPVALMRYLVRLVTPKDGIVLDPFAGTGTTLEAAYLEGNDSIGIEREDEYAEDIEKRMAKYKQELF